MSEKNKKENEEWNPFDDTIKSILYMCYMYIYDNTLQRCNAHGIVLFYKYEFTTSNDI